MIKKIVVLALAVLMFASCGQNSGSEAPEVIQEHAELLPSLTPGDLLDNPDAYAGKRVMLTGMVQHVCEKTGKRMFLSGAEGPEKTFKVTAGHDIGEFSIDLNGSEVVVEGVVKMQRVDQAYLDNWEAEISTGVKPEEAHQGHGPEGEDEESEVEDARRQLENMRNALLESGKDELLFYSLEAEDYREN